MTDDWVLYKDMTTNPYTYLIESRKKIINDYVNETNIVPRRKKKRGIERWM